MVEFKLCIADPSSGKTYQKEVKDAEANHFLGMLLGQSVKGEMLGLTGSEFLITGGSDKAGFPMRKGIKGARKKLTLLGGIGLRKNFSKGVKKRKTVCGHRISETISQINLKVTKEGSKKLADSFSAPAETTSDDKPAEAPKEKPTEKRKDEAPKEDKPEAPKEEAPVEDKPKESPKEAKPTEAPKEPEPKEAPKEDKPAENTEEQPKETTKEPKAEDKKE